MTLKAPFPYFGGKSTVAADVWAALGQPRHYIEPFFGSGAVLLSRQSYDPDRHVETVCDKDGFIANVWRGIQFAPDEVARWCDWPVNHADLNARRKNLIRNEGYLLKNLIKDPEWCDPKLAGYWIWAASCWIGSGLTKKDASPYLNGANQGVHVGQIPHLTVNKGVHVGQIPLIKPCKAGQRPIIHPSRGHALQSARSQHIYDWLNTLSVRLRHVRVVCGDWTRVCGGNWQDEIGEVGIFFDPPYCAKGRSMVYHHDSSNVAAEVNTWCLARGAKPTYRIVLAGYGEHQNLLSHGWTAKAWKAAGGYGNRAGNQNRHKETLYMSPYCLNKQISLFDKEEITELLTETANEA